MSASSLPARAAIAGGGTMGAGLAAVLTLAGVPTTVFVRRSEAVAETAERMAARLAAHVRLGLLDERGADAARALLEVREGIGGGPYDVAIESIVEDADEKRALLPRLEAELAPGGVLCTNTSSLALAELASAVAARERFAGWHWFHPADLFELVEIVPDAETAAATLDRLRTWSLALGKAPVVLARDIEGFVFNRLQYALVREAYALVEAGICTREDVDLVVTAALGARWGVVGPFASADLAGLGVHSAVARQLFPRLSRETGVPASLEEEMASGARGAAAGRGLLGDYSEEAAAALVERRDAALAARLRRAPDARS